MATRFGMSPELGVVSCEDDAAPMLDGVADAWMPRTYADTTASRIDQAVKEFMDQALAAASPGPASAPGGSPGPAGPA